MQPAALEGTTRWRYKRRNKIAQIIKCCSGESEMSNPQHLWISLPHTHTQTLCKRAFICCLCLLFNIVKANTVNANMQQARRVHLTSSRVSQEEFSREFWSSHPNHMQTPIALHWNVLLFCNKLYNFASKSIVVTSRKHTFISSKRDKDKCRFSRVFWYLYTSENIYILLNRRKEDELSKLNLPLSVLEDPVVL